MDFITHLWLPILLSGAAVWIISALGWMVIGHHNKDMQTLPNEQAFIDSLKAMNVKPGVYGYPNFHDCKKMTKEERMAKMTQQPMGILRVWNPAGMGLNMLYTFFIYLIIGVFVAYIGHATLKPGEPFTKVFQVLGHVGVMAYCFGTLAGDLWYQESRRAMLTKFIDGVVYGLATGAIFAALWPKV